MNIPSMIFIALLTAIVIISIVVSILHWISNRHYRSGGSGSTYYKGDRLNAGGSGGPVRIRELSRCPECNLQTRFISSDSKGHVKHQCDNGHQWDYIE